jgi:glycosyltransferase involved in cell wall biosynthesis
MDNTHVAAAKKSPIVREVASTRSPMAKPVVAIVSNALTPYRLHYHRRLVREVPGIIWHSLFTHDVSNSPWGFEAEAEIHSVRFGVGEHSNVQSKLSGIFHEYRKGGRIIDWLIEHKVNAVVILGYNDAGRLRIIRWCRRHEVPCFLFGDSNIKGDRATRAKASIKRFLLARILRYLNGVLACGSLGRQYFRKYGVPDERIFYAPYEPDYAMIASVTSQGIADEFCRRGLSQDRDYLLYCGRLAPVKRVDLLINAFCRTVANQRPNWDLLIVGDGPMRSELENLVPLDLKQRVQWAGFSADQRQVACLQRGARVLVLPSDDEPWGVVINEAAANGLAIIATDIVGAAAELVSNRVNGRIIPPNDLSALTTALLDVTDPAALMQYRAASPGILMQWRRNADPVAGLLAALATSGVVSKV